MKPILAILVFLCLFEVSNAQNRAVSIYNSDSTIVGTGVMNNNRMDGLWKFTDPKTDRLIQQGLFEEGKKDGTWTVYHPNSRKHIEAEYRNNLLNGAYREFDTEGALVLESIFKDSVQIGSLKQYYVRADRPDYV